MGLHKQWIVRRLRRLSPKSWTCWWHDKWPGEIDVWSARSNHWGRGGTCHSSLEPLVGSLIGRYWKFAAAYGEVVYSCLSCLDLGGCLLGPIYQQWHGNPKLDNQHHLPPSSRSITKKSIAVTDPPIFGRTEWGCLSCSQEIWIFRQSVQERVSLLGSSLAQWVTLKCCKCLANNGWWMVDLCLINAVDWYLMIDDSLWLVVN